MTDYHWTPALRRAFLETLSETGSVTEACRTVSMSRRAAYNLRHRRCGFAFRIGWDAAILLARDVVADVLMDRVLEGQWVETIRDKEAGSTKRFSYDRNLSLALLNRLDKRADEVIGGDTFSMAAQMVMQDFEAFLALVEAEAGPTEVHDFLETFAHDWSHGNVVALTEGFDWPTPLPEPANDTAPETHEQCELAQNSADLETTETPEPAPEPDPTHRPFHRLPSNTPSPADPEYHAWIRRQRW